MDTYLTIIIAVLVIIAYQLNLLVNFHLPKLEIPYNERSKSYKFFNKYIVPIASVVIGLYVIYLLGTILWSLINKYVLPVITNLK